MISDILDPDTFDVMSPISSGSRLGWRTFLVGFWPFYEDTLLVFNRNSIHAVFRVVRGVE